MKLSTLKTLLVSAALAVSTVLVLKSSKAGPSAESVPAHPKKLAPQNQQSAVNRAVQTAPTPIKKTNQPRSN